ncbi:MAG TPA: FAD-binding protein [Firmicutes bacterium]|jgi:fumarate reductase flavoprotein subunit|nr:FAD-binding protein [Bacillota bacterium]
MSQPQLRVNSPIVTLLLFLAVIFFFILQISLNPKPRQGTTVYEFPEGADVAVVGGTTAALLASLEAAENGAQVFLFPNGQELGEDAAFLFQEGLAAALTPPQEELGIELTPEIFGEIIAENGGWLNNPPILESFQEASPLFYHRFEKICGLTLESLPDPAQKPYLHFSGDPLNGSLFKQQLLLNLSKSPVIVKKEKVREILYSPEEAIESLLVEKAPEETYPIYFRAVILADGGYSGDLQRWHDYMPPANLIVLRPSQKGEGLKLAEKMGVDLAQMGFFGKKCLLYNSDNKEHGVLPSEPWDNTYLLNKNGTFLKWSESTPDEVFNFITHSPPAGVYLFFSGENIYIEKASAYDAFFHRFEDPEQLASALSLEDMSLISGERLFPPYYAAHLRAGIDYTLGGILTTPNGEVKKDGKIIKGLYAAGEIIGGLHGKAMLPGMPLSETLYSAENSGKAAAEYAQR